MGLLDKVKETAQKGADFAKEGVKAGQDKLDTMKVEKKIAELKAELGSVVFEQHTGSAPADADAQIARIVSEIKEAEVQLLEGEAADAAAEAEPASESGA